MPRSCAQCARRIHSRHVSRMSSAEPRVRARCPRVWTTVGRSSPLIMIQAGSFNWPRSPIGHLLQWILESVAPGLSMSGAKGQTASA